jgi:hypothetical protein
MMHGQKTIKLFQFTVLLIAFQGDVQRFPLTEVVHWYVISYPLVEIILI